MYIDPKTKVEDNRSTAWSFSLVGGLGIICLILFQLDILPFQVADYQKIIITVVMGILFLVFLYIGISSFLSMKKIQESADLETSLDKEIMDWFLETYEDAMKSFKTEDMDLESPETLYYPRYDKISELILEKYPSISEEFKDHIVEQLYASIFPE